MMPMENCPFCNPEIEKSAFLASANYLAIYNRRPILPGHSLVIPKSHYGSLMDLPEELLAELMTFGIGTVKLLMRAFQATAFDWTIQDGWAAGQTVPHLHLHLIPRKEGDLPEPGDWYPEFEKSINPTIDSNQRHQLGDDAFFPIIRYLRARADESDL
jgi:bis(5'-adenosyl)-triphosphatase